MSARSTDALAWLRERYPLWRFLPLAVFLVTAAQARALSWEPMGLAHAVLLALGLVLQFRLWDDLESLPEDRVEHPGRVLCQARSLTPFLALLGATAALNIALLRSAPQALLGYAALCALALAWYRWLAPRLSRGALAAHGLLLKYPAFVVLLHSVLDEGPLPPLAPVLVYLCLCVHELLHDRRLLSRPGMPLLLKAEVLALWTVLALSFLQTLNFTLRSRP